MYIHRVYTFAYAQSEVRAGRGTSIIAKLSQEYLEARGGIELEATCGRKRSGEPAAEIPSRARDLYHRETVAGISGGAGRNRTADRGFADLGLTTWRPRPFLKRWAIHKTLAAERGQQNLERETGFEPATSTLARSHSTTELLPLVLSFYSTCVFTDNLLSPQWHARPLSAPSYWPQARSFGKMGPYEFVSAVLARPPLPISRRAGTRYDISAPTPV